MPCDYNTEGMQRCSRYLSPRFLAADGPGEALSSWKGCPPEPANAQSRPKRTYSQMLRALDRVEIQQPRLRSHQFASERFHLLLNSFLKVLFDFPSRYLSATGLMSVSHVGCRSIRHPQPISPARGLRHLEAGQSSGMLFLASPAGLRTPGL